MHLRRVLRFRLSVVLTVGFTYSMVSQANHDYWLVLNAFLLLRPMYEDSATRIKTRFIGTLAGCLILQFLLPLFHGTGWHFVLATVMATGLYKQPNLAGLFSTCFALTLTTLALRMLAAELPYPICRRCYGAGTSRKTVFVFPTHQKGQYRYNLYQLFHTPRLPSPAGEQPDRASGLWRHLRCPDPLPSDSRPDYPVFEKGGNEDSGFIKNFYGFPGT